jgi:hypothetical protein
MKLNLKINIKNLLFLSCLIWLQSFNAQTALPYYSGFDNASQKAGWTEYVKGGSLTVGWQYVNFNSYSPGTCLHTIYSTFEDLDNWFVSPSFSIPSGGNLDSIRYLFNGLSQPGINDSICLYLLNGSQDPSFANKVLLFDFRGSEVINDNVYRKKSNLNLPAFSGLSYFAIRYKCEQSVWLEPQFDNISISSLGSAPIANFSITSNSFCKGELVKFNDLSSNSPSNWKWKFEGGTPFTSALSQTMNPSYIFPNSGTYTITLSSYNSSGWGAEISKTLTVNLCNSFSEENFKERNISVYPNPNHGKFSVDFYGLESQYIYIYSSRGELVYKDFIEKNSNKTINIETLPDGLYFVRLDFMNGKNIKLVKN